MKNESNQLKYLLFTGFAAVFVQSMCAILKYFKASDCGFVTQIWIEKQVLRQPKCDYSIWSLYRFYCHWEVVIYHTKIQKSSHIDQRLTHAHTTMSTRFIDLRTQLNRTIFRYFSDIHISATHIFICNCCREATLMCG